MLRRLRPRLYLACALLSAWLFLLLIGITASGWVHAALVAGIVLMPWRAPSA